MRNLLTWTVVLACVAPALGQTDKVFEAKTCRYTGGQYPGEQFAYRLMKPAKIEPGTKYPLILLLHGAGERGTDNRRQLKYFGDWMAGPEMRKKYPCFVLAPQCRPGKRWEEVNWAAKESTPLAKEPGDQMKVAIAVLLKTVHEEPIDTSRVYLCDLRKAFLAERKKRGAKEHKGVLTVDGVHLNAAGNRFVADQAAAAIAEALKSRK